MAHGGVEESEFLLVVLDMSAAGIRFDHSDKEIGGRGGDEGVRWEELIPQNPDQAHQGRLGEIGRGQVRENSFLVPQDKRGNIGGCLPFRKRSCCCPWMTRAGSLSIYLL